jgi:hypothetical protein
MKTAGVEAVQELSIDNHRAVGRQSKATSFVADEVTSTAEFFTAYQNGASRLK